MGDCKKNMTFCNFGRDKTWMEDKSQIWIRCDFLNTHPGFVLFFLAFLNVTYKLVFEEDF